MYLKTDSHDAQLPASQSELSCPDREEREAGSVALPAFFQNFHGQAFAASARVTQGGGRVKAQGGGKAVAQIQLVARSDDRKSGHGPQPGEIKGAMMGGAVFSHQSRPVKAEGDGQLLQADVMDDLIIGPLEEGGIDGHHRRMPRAASPAASVTACSSQMPTSMKREGKRV